MLIRVRILGGTNQMPPTDVLKQVNLKIIGNGGRGWFLCAGKEGKGRRGGGEGKLDFAARCPRY